MHNTPNFVAIIGIWMNITYILLHKKCQQKSNHIDNRYNILCSSLPLMVDFKFPNLRPLYI